MRILGFSEKWDKLKQPVFTTFRFPRKDRDWEKEEIVQIVCKPRIKGGGEKLGIAKIVAKQKAWMDADITEQEAKDDGFSSLVDMRIWFVKTYGIRRLLSEPMNKLTLVWVERTK